MTDTTYYLILVLMWAIYFTLHSFLASNYAKEIFLKVGVSLKRQRIVYNTLAIAGLFFIMLFGSSKQSEYIFQKSRLSEIIALFLTAIGIIIIRKSFRNYSMKEFIGLKEEKGALVVNEGISKYIRHPIYAGTILIVLGYFLFDPRVTSLITLLCIYIYLIIGIKLEESKLLKAYGERYEKYKKEVPAIIPKLKSLF